MNLKEAKEIVREVFNLWGCPELKYNMYWNFRLTSTGGKARYRLVNGKVEYEIELSPNIFLAAEKLGKSDQQRITVIHEAAHIAAHHLTVKKYKDYYGLREAYRLGGKVGHKGLWRTLMYEMGLEPDRCHNIDAVKAGVVKQRKRNKRITVLCGCTNGVEITKNRYTRMLNGKGYRCMKCRRALRLS